MKTYIWACCNTVLALNDYDDELALASIMTHYHAKDLCASELGPLRI